MVPPEEFDRARRLVGEAIEKAYSGFTIPPVEIAPGYWEMWPLRGVVLKLQETKYWIYGRPVGGTGNLQAHISWPYGNNDRIRSKGPFDARLAKKAAAAARNISDILVAHYGSGPATEQAYLAGVKAVETASDGDLRRLWPFREATYLSHRADWDSLHEGIRAFLKMRDDRKGILDWSPDEDVSQGWEVHEKALGSDWKVYDMAMRGVLDALDDWAVRVGLLDNAKRLSWD